MRIGVVAPSAPITAEVADQVTALAAALHPGLELVFHPQCFLVHNHFAGPDEARADAFVDYANDVALDGIWFARGGYGSCRMAEEVLDRLQPAAWDKHYIGYSDAGFLLAGLYRAGVPRVAHGPMPRDIVREGGEAAVARSLGWFATGDAEALEPGLDALPAAAFNLTVLSQLIGTALEPDLTGHVLLIEEVSEYMYRIDRSLFHLTSNPSIRRIAGLRLGRCTEIPPNDPDFGEAEEDVARFWCKRAHIPYLGRADIGHDSANRIVPFGRFGA